MRDLSASVRTGRLFAHTFIAWVTMIGLLVLYWGGQYVTGTLGDPDFQSVGEALLVPVFFMSLPFAGIAVGILLPFAIGLQSISRGRLTRPMTVAAGVVLGVPAAVATGFIGWLMFGRDHSLAAVQRGLMAVGRHPLHIFDWHGPLPYLTAIVVGMTIVSAAVQSRDERLIPDDPQPTGIPVPARRPVPPRD
jgi:hypothetical protein